MRAAHTLGLVIALGIFVTGGLFAAPAKPAKASKPSQQDKKEFLAAKNAFLKQVRSRTPADRIEAYRKFAEYGTPEAAEVIFKMGALDRSKEVRRAAIDALMTLRESSEVGEELIAQMMLAARRDKENSDDYIYAALWALGAWESPEIQGKVLKFLDDIADNPNPELLTYCTLMDDLGVEGNAQALKTLMLLSQARLFEKNFGYRRAVVQNICQVLIPESIPFLIGMLSKTDGLVQHDIVQHLTNVTLQKFKDDDAAWAKWWADNKAKFKMPDKNVLAKRDINIDDGTPTYYGIPICAKRVVFVLDTSGSMRGNRLDNAKRELIAAIERLPDEVQISMVFYNSTARVWNAQMVPANDVNKKLALYSIMQQEAAGQTASYDALDGAFTIGPEAIFFLSDGAPTTGKYVAPADIVGVITQGNKTRRVSIHTIGLGEKGIWEATLGKFMQALAAANWGTYRAVES
ncbi:MAG TPA: VWA domain-containing protein [Planctomycetaceae bacterium]|nr:VWA domain-containing protein [Planctomycetaceae bacterium]